MNKQKSGTAHDKAHAATKGSPKRSPIQYKVKLSPKKVAKKVFNPFGIDLSSNVEKILGTDS